MNHVRTALSQKGTVVYQDKKRVRMSRLAPYRCNKRGHCLFCMYLIVKWEKQEVFKTYYTLLNSTILQFL